MALSSERQKRLLAKRSTLIAIVAQLEDSMLKAAQTGYVQSSTLDTGASEQRVVYKSVGQIDKDLRVVEAQLRRVENQLAGTGAVYFVNT